MQSDRKVLHEYHIKAGTILTIQESFRTEVPGDPLTYDVKNFPALVSSGYAYNFQSTAQSS